MTVESHQSQPPLIGTKLRPPRRRRASVARPRLVEPGASGTPPALTLVSAPAGFGKTTLVADWFAEGCTAWLALDPSDDDPIRFWTYAAAALERAIPELGSGTSSLLQDPSASVDAAVATLINDVEAAACDVVLVLDDYHLVQDPRIHHSMGFLLEHLPEGLRVVITTRADPPLPLAALRAAGELFEVRAADLRFTADEAAEYLHDSMGISLSAQDVDALDRRTEGWIAALQLAALSMQGRQDPSAFVAEFAGDDRFILDYLADEVLERQPPEVLSFLLDTSVLERLGGPLCAAVTGDARAAATLEQLDRSNLFVISLDDRRGWYRYHHLFADILRARLRAEDPSRLPELHRRASDWYAANDHLPEAVDHALQAADWARAAELVERAAPATNRSRQETLLRSWLERIPDDVYDQRPVLTVLLVGARMSTGDRSGVEPLLERAERWIDAEDEPIVTDADEYARLPATIAMYRAALALLDGNPDAALRDAGRVLQLVGPDDPLRLGAATALIGLARWHQGELATAHDHYVRAVSVFEAGGFLPDVMGCSLALADIQITQGRLDAAQRTFESALRHTHEHPGLRGAADMHVGLAMIAIHRVELTEAAEHLRAAAELGEWMGLPQHPYRWRVATAWLCRAEGDLDSALEWLTAAEPLYHTDFSPPVRPVVALKAMVQLELGDLRAARRWADSTGLRADDAPSYVRELEHLVLARTMAASGSSDDLEQATRLLERLLAAAERGGREGSAIDILVVQSDVQRRAGHGSAAGATLAEAVLRAGQLGSRLIVDDLGRHGMQDRSSEQAGRRRRVADPNDLSDRELDVLRLLRGDLSGPEIARELHVSLNTLRTHTKHIYTKLGVTNRREAVSAAARLGL
jgi:LuxR family maltose regulon positive regulatory protein